ncbi:MAG: endolytic transglycosylase MltG [Prolixibacteraceae bacterium]|nr:endolytic transglycosylase MltG [Prolixibacteraceae bacterium]
MSIQRKNRAQVFPKLSKISIIVFAVLLIGSGYRAFELFGYIFNENVKRSTVILIPTGAGFKQVDQLMTQHELLENPKAFRWVSKKKEYTNAVKPGRYEIKQGWNTNQLVNLLRSGEQTPVKLTFNNVRFFEDLAGKVSRYFESDSLNIYRALGADTLPAYYGFTPETLPAMFIPNTYEFYWTTSPQTFIDRMHKEYQRFWNDERKAKADALGLTPVEVATLASIVQEETVKEDEKPVVAGLYLNRIKRGMLLQADPTVKFALHDFTIRRVTNEMLEINSPYNTYKYAGLPPGPINFPEISSIEAVLNPQKHAYLYMCAKDDFSGYHYFSSNLAQHNIYAARYRNALNRNKIWK